MRNIIKVVYKVRKNAYSYNVGVLKKYGNGTYKVSCLKACRNKGVNLTFERVAKNAAHEDKLDCNIRRAKSKVKEYVLCNSWDYFMTLTLDPKKYDRYNLKKFHKELSVWLQNLNRKREQKIKFILIPEQHKDGAWHMHGFISGLTSDDVRLFKVTDKIPKYIKNKLIEGQEVYNWLPYMEKFGFCDLEPIRSVEKASSYVLKYITKDLARCVKEVGAHLYYCSRGLNKAEIIKKGEVSAEYSPTYVDEHVSVQWLNGVSEQVARSYIQGDNSTKDDIFQEFELRKSGFRDFDMSELPFD